MGLQGPSEAILVAHSISNESANGETKGQGGEGLTQGHKAISGLKSKMTRGEASRFLWGWLCSYILTEKVYGLLNRFMASW